jgi:hypothetical protein
MVQSAEINIKLDEINDKAGQTKVRQNIFVLSKFMYLLWADIL